MQLHSPLIRRVDFRSRDRRRLVVFYENVLGLRETRTEDRFGFLAGPDGHELVGVEEDATATTSPGRSTGLYHIAFLLPSRAALARAATTLLDMGWGLQGFVDHGVSESLYIEDPDGNGVELTWDKEHSDWPRTDGQPTLRTRGLHLRDLLDNEWASLSGDDVHHTGPVIGHVHLTVSDLGVAEELFVNRLSLKCSHQALPGALFFTRDGYHHYFAANQWLGPTATGYTERRVGWIGLHLAEELGDGIYLSHSDLGGGCEERQRNRA